MSQKFTSYAQIQQLRLMCIHECGVISSIEHAAILMDGLSPEEIQRIQAWCEERRQKAIAWCDYDEQNILNNVDGLPRMKGGPPPSGRRATVNLSPFGGGEKEFANIVSLIWMMCAIFAQAAIAESTPDISQIFGKILTELRRLKQADDERPPKGGEVVTRAAAMLPKPKPRGT